MKVMLTFRHMEADEDMKSYVEEKLNKLADKYFHRPTEAEVIIDVEKFRHIAEITVKADHTRLVAKEQTEDTRSAVDLALDKIEVQAQRHREKIKTRKKTAGGAGLVEGVESGTAAGESPAVVKVDKFVPKPYSVEDAMLLLEEQEQEFIVFRNADSLEICVLYRRPDNNYGLIETGE